jgi:glutamate-ammonia-ligase adenylyltransferase
MNSFQEDFFKVSSYSRFFHKATQQHEFKKYIEENGYKIIDSQDIKKLLKVKEFDEKSFLKTIRKVRTKIFLHLMFQDILQLQNYKYVVNTYSMLADECLKVSFDYYAEQMNISKDYFYIIAMGKLGGKELNVSSDIDIIFTYKDHENPKEKLSQQYQELAKKIIFALNDNDENGYAFRVDTRLRPYGSEGRLVSSLNFLEDYYLNHGREWERYAWIKARTVVGDSHIIKKITEPFVYRKYLDFKTISEIRALKKIIKKDLDQKQKGSNIKLGDGGIREIEFIVQAFQLIRAGRQNNLKIANTIEALEVLHDAKIIRNKNYTILTKAYIFLRNLEHKIQYLDDKQTHTIPNEDDLKLIAHASDLTFDQFIKNLSFHQKNVHNLFIEIFNNEEIEENPKYEYFSKKNEQLIRNYYQSSLWNKLPLATQERIEILFEHLDKEISQKDFKEEIFNQIFDLIIQIASRSNYIAFFVEYKNCFNLLIYFASRSSWIINYIKKHPVLIDDILFTQDSYAIDFEKLYDESFEKLKLIKHLDEQYDFLRDLKHKLIFQLAVMEIKEEISLEIVSDQLTYIADFFIKLCINIIRDSYPKKEIFDHFAVIAYGKYGAMEMSYSSDLDIIFLYDPIVDDKDSFIVIAKKLSAWFSSYTNAGILYDIDLNLRPNGNNGMLVSSFDAFQKYQLNNAWLWEHQALTKARFCFGLEGLKRKFDKIRAQILQKSRNDTELKNEIVKMRKKMLSEANIKFMSFDIKNSKGGLIDIEFLVQYFILLKSRDHSELLNNKGNLALIKELGKLLILNKNDTNLLKTSYKLYRKAIHQKALNNQTTYLLNDKKFETMANDISACFEKYFGNY